MKWVKNKYLYLLLIVVFIIASVDGVGVSICFADTMTPQEIVDSAKTSLVLENTDELVSSNVTLPVTGANGATITWVSDKPLSLANDGVLINQPTYAEGPVVVNLTATISFETASTNKVFPITIRPTPNVVTNYGFEDGYLKYLSSGLATNWFNNNIPGTVQLANDVYHGGKTSILIPTRPYGYSHVVHYFRDTPETKLIANKKYLVSVWAKIAISDNDKECPLDFYIPTPSGATAPIGVKSSFSAAVPYSTGKISLSNDWKEMRNVVTFIADQTGDPIQMMTSSNFDHFSYYLDDYSVQPVVPYSITATGAASINIPIGNNVKNETYTYNILNQLGTTDEISAEKALWSIVGNHEGVSINSDSGILQVTPTATEDTITVRAASQSYSWLKKDIQVQLKQLTPVVPIASHVNIISNTTFQTPGMAISGAILTSDYQYEDENLDAESDSTYKWIATDSLSAMTGEVLSQGETIAIEDPITHLVIHKDKATNMDLTYTVKYSDIGKYIRFVVTPIAINVPKVGLEVGSNAIVIQGQPEAKNAEIVIRNTTITGQASVGNILYAKYNYAHPNGYLESGSTYKWICGGRVVGTDCTYTVVSGDAGQSIYFEVTPKADQEPQVGLPVVSPTISIAQISSGTRGTTGGRSGVTSISVVKPVETAVPTPTPPVTTTAKFNDLNNHWAKADIEQLVAKGIIKGKDNDTFAPDLSITRAEFAAIIVRALGLKETKFGSSFKDIADGVWYADIVQTVADNKLIVGNEGAFRPEDNITREEMAKIVVEAYKIITSKELPQGNSTQFEDQDNMGIWAVDYINSATELGIINGVDDTHFDPKAVATRAQATVIIKRLLDKK